VSAEFSTELEDEMESYKKLDYFSQRWASWVDTTHGTVVAVARLEAGELTLSPHSERESNA